MQNKTLAFWIVGVVGVILVILVIVQLHNQNYSSTTQPTSTSNSTSPNNGGSTSTEPVVGSAGSKAGNAAYNAALAIYQKSGYRIQFSQCHGIPGTLVIPTGVKYMLDNRDGAAHTIKVGPSTYRVGPYGYVILTASNVGLNNVTCDGGGAAQLNIEK